MAVLSHLGFAGCSLLPSWCRCCTATSDTSPRGRLLGPHVLKLPHTHLYSLHRHVLGAPTIYLDYIPPQHMIPTSWYLPQPILPQPGHAELASPSLTKAALCTSRTLHYLYTLLLSSRHGLELDLLTCMHEWLHWDGMAWTDGRSTAMNGS